MKLNKVLLVLVSFFVFSSSVKAGVCDSEHIKQLNELAKNTKIIFDRNSNDERVKLITLNTEKKFMKNIKLSAVLVFYTRLVDKEDKEWFDSVNFVYNDNIEYKKEFANEITNTFVERYDNLTLDDE